MFLLYPIVIDIYLFLRNPLHKSGFVKPRTVYIEISYMYENYWTYDILTIPRHDLIGLSDRPIIRYNTYEEALEAGLQEALKLI